MLSAQKVIMTVIVLIIIGSIIGLGLVYISALPDMKYEVNGTYYTVEDSVDSTVLTLLTTLVPILVVVGLALYFIPKMKGD